MGAVAQLRQQADTLEFEQGDRVPPRLDLLPEVVAHPRFLPAHPVCQAQLIEKAQKGVIRHAVEVIEALDAHAAEIKAGRHSPDTVVGFEENRPMPVEAQLPGNRQPHRPRADDGYAFPRFRRRVRHGCSVGR